MNKIASQRLNIHRSEANFDRACDEAYRQTLNIFGIDEDGNSDQFTDWERSECRIEVLFVSYCRQNNAHIYTFDAAIIRDEDE